MVKDRVQLGGLLPEMWIDEHNPIIDEFITGDQRLLVAYNDTINGLTFEPAIPVVPVREITYFIKQVMYHCSEYRIDNILRFYLQILKILNLIFHETF